VSDVVDFQVVMGALELGIIPPGWDVDKALADMSVQDALVCKRKFRKIVKKARKKFGHVEPVGEKLPASLRRKLARRVCVLEGHKLIE